MPLFWRTEALLFLGAITVRLLFHFLTGFTADDAFITFRYAENILAGHGFVYNLGDHVLGTSTPLFTLLLATLGILPGSVPSWALFVSVTASGLTAVVLYRFARSLRFASFAIIPALLYICWPRSLPGDTCGMETALFTLLVTAAFHAQQRKLPYWGLALVTLATLTRPEGVLLLCLLIVVNAIADRSRIVSYLLTPLSLAVPWGLFAWSYFGSAIPNSISAKLALYSQFGSGSAWEKLRILLWLNNPLGWLLLGAFVVGAYWLAKKQNFGRSELLWLGAMILFFALSKTHLFFWYIPPIYPIALLISSAALPYWCERFSLSRINQDRLAVVFSFVAAIALLGADSITTMQYKASADTLASCHAEIGYYLRTHADERDIVAAEDIGYMGYISGLRFIDRDGLVSPEVVSYNRIGDYGGVIEAFEPTWVVAVENSPISGFLTEPDFTDRYERIRSFGTGEDSEYLLFRRQ